MIRLHRQALLLWCIGLFAASAFAQTPDHPDGIGVRYLFLDHFTPNIGDRAETQQLTGGIEVHYVRNLGSKYVNAVVPVKLALARYPESFKDVRFTSIDLLFQGILFGPEKVVSPYLFAGGGMVMENYKESNIQFPFGLGSHVRITRAFYLNAQVEYRMSMASARDNLQYGAGFVYVPGLHRKPAPRDTDGDGIPDLEDACPLLAGPAEWMGCPDTDGDGLHDHMDLCPQEAGPLSAQGCPDADGDGVPDHLDRCPDDPGSKELEGCPDTDGDGIPDVDDLCPEEAGLPAHGGCPAPEPVEEEPKEVTSPAIADRDGDGIPDHLDLCPDIPGVAALGGCPEPEKPAVVAPIEPPKAVEPPPAPVKETKPAPVVAEPTKPVTPPAPKEEIAAPAPPPAIVPAAPVSGDRDGDGVPDNLDRCPDTPGPASNDGCPVISSEDRSVLDLAMRSVQFETGSPTILPESFRTLDRIADIMTRYRDYQLIINGHTDNVGRPQSNLALSEERARACYNYLISRGIRADRMIHSGFGDARPLTSNRTDEGRSINRRVEFIMYLK